MTTIEYFELPVNEVSQIKPLWEGLNGHHLANTHHFQEYYRAMTFEQRIHQISNKILKITAAKKSNDPELVGYCIASISPRKGGEIESLYVLPEYRETGVGTGLMRRSLNWLTDNGITDIGIGVAAGNEVALPFYERFGFVPRLYVLKNPEQLLDDENQDH